LFCHNGNSASNFLHFLYCLCNRPQAPDSGRGCGYFSYPPRSLESRWSWPLAAPLCFQQRVRKLLIPSYLTKTAVQRVRVSCSFGPFSTETRKVQKQKGAGSIPAPSHSSLAVVKILLARLKNSSTYGTCRCLLSRSYFLVAARYKITRTFSSVISPPSTISSSLGSSFSIRSAYSTTSTMIGRSCDSRKILSV